MNHPLPTGPPKTTDPSTPNSPTPPIEETTVTTTDRSSEPLPQRLRLAEAEAHIENCDAFGGYCHDCDRANNQLADAEVPS